MNAEPQKFGILTAKDVMQMMSWRSADTLYTAIKKGFPRPHKFGPKCSRWDAQEIYSWIKSQPRGASDPGAK